LLKQVGAAGLVVTHDAADALRMADRIAVQVDGAILQIDNPESVYRHPANIDVAGMFGTVNLLKSVAGIQGFRPADVSLTGAADDFSFEGELVEARLMGANWLCLIKREDGVGFEALLSGDTPPELGAQKFFVPQARLMLFKE
jgi:ABC-type Fe3+/spermidine/putrescine transport system ATPase subunit